VTTAPRFRAWQFAHPDFDASEGAAGLQISPAGGITMLDEEASIRQAILLLLSTQPGERVMRPRYGCDLQKLLFSPNDATTAGLAIHYVRTALSRWEPRIEITCLDAIASPDDPGLLLIHLEYRIRSTRRTDRNVFALRVTEE
jgi:uncharacterized protein